MCSRYEVSMNKPAARIVQRYNGKFIITKAHWHSCRMSQKAKLNMQGHVGPKKYMYYIGRMKQCFTVLRFKICIFYCIILGPM